MSDLPDLYRAHNDALCALVTDLGDDELGRPVPATPRWTPREVLCHQAGVAADMLSGNMDGAPGSTWTDRQVSERLDRSVAEVADELCGHADGVAAVVAKAEEAGRPPAMLWDITVHHADLHEALGRGRLAEPMWRPVLEQRLQMVPDARALLDDGVDPYELFRVVFSRRSREQVRALAPSLSPEQVDALGAFGPRDDDQPVPDPTAEH